VVLPVSINNYAISTMICVNETVKFGKGNPSELLKTTKLRGNCRLV
jgi:hypothetical protein